MNEKNSKNQFGEKDKNKTHRQYYDASKHKGKSKDKIEAGSKFSDDALLQHKTIRNCEEPSENHKKAVTRPSLLELILNLNQELV